MKNVVNALRKSSPKHNAYATADTVNAEGAKAWTPSTATLVQQLSMTGTLGNTFYASSQKLVENAVEVFQKANPQDLADAIVKGRNEGFIRAANILGLVVLSQRSSILFQKVFNDVVITGNDLEDFVNLARSTRGIGRSVCKAIHGWINTKLSSFYALRYGKQVADAARISHYPGKSNCLVQYCMARYNEKADTKTAEKKHPQLKAYAKAIKALEAKKYDKLKEIIVEHKLDVMSIVGHGDIDDEVWEAFAEVMPVMQTLKHLNKLDRSGALLSLDQLDVVMKKITVENLQKARVFPFRLYIAWLNVTNSAIRNHLADVLDTYLDVYDWSAFDKAGTWAICPDVSGSMTGAVSGSSLTPNIVSGLFSGFFYRGLKHAEVYPWADRLGIYDEPKRDSVITHVNNLVKAGGGGTNMGIALAYFRQQGKSFDNLLFITDSEEFNRCQWFDEWKKYRSFVNKKARAFLIRVDSNNTNPFDEKDAVKNGIHQVYGWSDNVIKYIEFALSK